VEAGWATTAPARGLAAGMYGSACAFIRTNVRVSEVSNDTCDLLCLDLPRAEALRRARLAPSELAAAANAAKALSDLTRLAVAVALRDGGELCVCDLGWVCERSDKLVSHHARALRGAGLVQSRREGKMVLYTLTARGERLLDATLGATAEAVR
jgi:DNA-binding transcriptional ArsR family regulator